MSLDFGNASPCAGGDAAGPSGPFAWSPVFDSMPYPGYGPTPLAVEGRLPEGLIGDLYRDGPAGNDLSRSLLDGDGALHRIALDAGQLTYRSRYIDTPKLAAERDQPSPVFRSLGNQRRGGAPANALRFLGNTANTGVLPTPDGLLALFEGGHPWLVDPDDLHTIGDYDFHGQLGRRPLGPLFFSAHPKRDPTGDVWNFGMFYGRRSGLHTYRIDGRGRLHAYGFVSLPVAVHNHDFGVTDRWLVFVLCPARFDRYRFILGVRSFHDAMRWAPEHPTYVVLVSKRSRRKIVMETDPFFSFHVVNAFEDVDDVVVDVVRYDDMQIWDDLAHFRTSSFEGFGGQLWRLRIKVDAGTIRGEPLSDAQVEFPSIDPRYQGRRHRHVYCAARRRDHGLHHAIAAIDTDTGAQSVWDPGFGHVVSEPLFAPAPRGTADADGWLLTVVFDPGTASSRVVVLPAAAPEVGPVATAELPGVMPYSFHGAWVPRAARPAGGTP